MRSTLGQKVRGLRTSMGINQGQLANRASISQSQVCLIEKGKSCNPTMGHILSLSLALNTTTDFLCGREEALIDIRIKEALTQERRASKKRTIRRTK